MLKNASGPLLTTLDAGSQRLTKAKKQDISELLLDEDFDTDFLLRDLRNETTAIETAKEMRAGRATAVDVMDLIKRSGFVDMEHTLILFSHELQLCAKRWAWGQRRKRY